MPGLIAGLFFRLFIWKYFVWPFWGGAVCVLAEDGDSVE